MDIYENSTFVGNFSFSISFTDMEKAFPYVILWRHLHYTVRRGGKHDEMDRHSPSFFIPLVADRSSGCLYR